MRGDRYEIYRVNLCILQLSYFSDLIIVDLVYQIVSSSGLSIYNNHFVWPRYLQMGVVYSLCLRVQLSSLGMPYFFLLARLI